MTAGRPRHGGLPVAGELSEDATTVRAAYRALEAGDEQALTIYVDPRIAWVHPMVARLPFDGVLRGLPSVVRAAFHRGEDGSGPRVSADTFLEFGDGVLVVGRFLGADDAEEIEEPFLHECSVRGGRIDRIRQYPADREPR